MDTHGVNNVIANSRKHGLLTVSKLLNILTVVKIPIEMQTIKMISDKFYNNGSEINKHVGNYYVDLYLSKK